MRSTLAALLSVTLLAAGAVAQPGSAPAAVQGNRPDPATGGSQPPGAPTGMTMTPPEPPKPTPLPVPGGPVVKKEEMAGGLLAEDIKIGEGAEVKVDSTVVAYYHGTLKADGSVFDSAYERADPFIFSPDGMIEGWKKAVPGMKVGGIRRLTVPAAMGYGVTGAPPKIPANSDLVFIVEIVDVVHWEDVKAGDGEEIWGMAVPVTTFTMKDKDGKELASADAAHPYAWIPGEVNRPGMRMDAVQHSIKGMKVGGKRRIHVPAAINDAPVGFVINRPLHVPLDIELELLTVRNLTPKPQPPAPTGATGATGAPTTPSGGAGAPPAPTGAPK